MAGIAELVVFGLSMLAPPVFLVVVLALAAVFALMAVWRLLRLSREQVRRAQEEAAQRQRGEG